jgi:calcineurin-like phosphoesterase family protein
MAEKWLIADLHLGHQRLIDGWGEEVGARKGPRSQFLNAHHMGEFIFGRWASVVAPQDKVYVLGDIAFKKDWLLAMRDLPGHKRAILGNHDKEKLADYSQVFVLTHIPVHPDQLSSRASMKVNIHGHLHDERITNEVWVDTGIGQLPEQEIDPRYVCVSCEQVDYTPINLDVIIERVRDLL